MSSLRVLFTTLLRGRFECVSPDAGSPRGTRIIGGVRKLVAFGQRRGRFGRGFASELT
jgi:hypothetical protein